MQSINCYDIEADEITALCDEYDLSEPELIQALIDAVREGAINIEDWT